MPENENYIGVAMGLDVSDLKAGLKETSMRIKEANAEFKTAASGMDDWQRSTDGVRAKVKQLDTVLSAQRSALAGLKAEYQQVVAAQGENSDAARRLQLRIQGQQAAINSTEREFNNYSQTLREAEAGNVDLTSATLENGKALKDQGKAADESSKGLDGLKAVGKGVAGGLLAVGTAVVGVVGGFLSLAESTRETRQEMAQIETAFHSAGFSSDVAKESFINFNSVLGDTGKSTETVQQLAAFAKSEQELTEYTRVLTGVYAQFGNAIPTEGLAEGINHTIQLGSVQGNLADALEWSGVNVDDFNAQLSACNTEEERSQLITSTLNTLYGEQADKYNELNKDVIESQEAQTRLNLAMAELGKIAEPIMTVLKNLATDLLTTITPFVQLIGEGLTGALNGSSIAAETLAEGIGGIINVLVEKLTNTLPMILNIVLELIPQIVTTLLNALPTLLDTVILLITDIINLISQMLPTIVQAIVEVIPKLITSLLNAIPQLLQAAITLLMAIVQAIPTIITSLLAALPKLINTIVDVLITSIPIIIQGAIQLLMGIIQAIPVIIQAITTNLPLIINAIISGLIKALPLILEAAITLLMAIIDAIPTIVNQLAPAMPKIINAITGALTDNFPVILKTAVQLFTQIVKAIPQIAMELLRNMPEIISAIVDGLSDGLSEISAAGLNIVKGIWNGIKSGKQWIKDKIQGFAGDVAGWFKKAFKIQSPSKLMADEVGLFVGEGVGKGVLNSMPFVKKDLSKFSNFIGTNLGSIKSGLSVNGVNNTLSGNSSGSMVINSGMTVNYNGTLSRKELRKIQQDNDRRIITKLKLQEV